MCKHTDTYISQVIQTENLTFCFLDSVFSTHQQKHENIVRHLCHAINKVEEWKEEAPKRVPKQKGATDCGVFLVMYALYMVLEVPWDFNAVSKICHYQ
jgi:Ulp1 family protease